MDITLDTTPKHRHLLKERKKTDTPNEGWDEDRVPTCTSRIFGKIERTREGAVEKKGKETRRGARGKAHTA